MRKLFSWKKLILVAVCIAMVFTLVACGSNNGGGGKADGNPTLNKEFGQLQNDPTSSLTKVAEALFAERQNNGKTNLGFNGDFKLRFGTNELVNVNMDLRLSVDTKDASNSKFSFVVNQKDKEIKKLIAASFNGVDLKFDTRGIDGHFYIVDTDIIYLANLVASAINYDKLQGTINDAKTYLRTLLPILAKSMVNAGALDVYEQYNAANGSSQITSTIYLKKTLDYVIKFLGGSGDIQGDLYNNIVKLIGKDKINEIIGKLTGVYKFIPAGATINLGLGIIGVEGNRSIVDGSFKVSFSNLEASVNAVDFSLDDQTAYVKDLDTPKGEETVTIRHAKLGALNFDVALDVNITEGKVTLADIDKALGGLLNGFVKDLDTKIDLSNNVIQVPKSAGTSLHVSFSAQLDIKDNNKTNILAEIYFENNEGKKTSVLSIYYVGKDQAFYIDLTGLGKAQTLPNKIKIDKDIDGNPINLTKSFSDFITNMLTEGGKLDFTALIKRVVGLFGKNEAAVSEEQIQTINQKLLTEYPLATVTSEQGDSGIDVFAILKIVLKELEWKYTDNQVFYGFGLEVSADMFQQIFKKMNMDISLFKGAKLNIDFKDGLHIGLEVIVNAETYVLNGATEEVAQEFPTLTIGANIDVMPFVAFNEARLPDDNNRHGGDWQVLELKKKLGKDGEIDLVNSLLASLSGKKVYASASAEFTINTDEIKDYNIGGMLGGSIGGALGRALADLQLRTGNISVTYTLNLIANVDLGSFVNMDTKADVMSIVKQVLGGDNEVQLTLKAKKEGGVTEDVLAMLLSKGALYLDAEKIGIPKTKVELEKVFDIIGDLMNKPGSGASQTATATAGEKDKNATLKTIIAVLAQVDVIKIMESEIAIGLNGAFLNVLIPMLTKKDMPIDLTLSKIQFALDFDSVKFTKEDYGTFLNKIAIEILLGANVGGGNLELKATIGGLNVGLVDTSENKDLTLRKEFFGENRQEEDFVNPLENKMLSLGLTGKLKLSGNAKDFTLNGKKLEGEIGSLLSTLALAIGLDNVNAELNINLAAAIDLVNYENNNSQVALTVTDKENKLLAGVYVYDGYVYANIPGLIKPFKVEFDVVSLIYDLIKNGGNKGDNQGNGTAFATDGTGAGADTVEALVSIISLTNKGANITLSANLIKGLVAAIIGNMTVPDDKGNVQLDKELGDDIITLIQSLPFDVLVLSSLSTAYKGSGKDTFLNNLEFDLNVYVGENLAGAYNSTNGSIDTSKLDGIGLGIGLGNIDISYINDNYKLPVIDEALKNNRFGDAIAKLDSTDFKDFDIAKVLKDTKASVTLDGYLAISSNGVDVNTDGTIDNNIQLYLKEILNTLPQLLINVGALQKGSADLMRVYFHLAVSADIGAILRGDFNSAIELSLGLYRKAFKGYDESKADKLLSIAALPSENGGGLSLYVDAIGLAKEGINNDILTGKVRLDNIDLNSLLGNIGGSGNAGATAGENDQNNNGKPDLNTTIIKVNSIVGIINSAISKLSINSNGLTVSLGENILGIIINLITHNDGTGSADALPYTTGDIRLVLKQYEEGGFTYDPGIHAHIGFKPRGEGQEETFGLGIGLCNLGIEFARLSDADMFESDFRPSDYDSLLDLNQVSVSLNLGLDVDMKEGVHILNLLSTYGKLVGALEGATALANAKLNVTEDGAKKDLHLGISIQGQIGIKDVSATQVKLQIRSYKSQEDRIKDAKGEPNIESTLIAAVSLYKDEIFFNSGILNFNNIKIPSLGFSKAISDKVKDLIGGIGAQSQAYSTANEADNNKLDFLIGNRQADIMVTKGFVTALLNAVILDENTKDIVNAIVDDLFVGLGVNLNLGTMSASISLDLIKNDNNASAGLVGITAAIQGLEVSVIEKDFFSGEEKAAFNTDYEEAKTNAFLEFGASVIIERTKLEKNKQITPDNFFGQVAGVVGKLDMLDQSIRDTINNILQKLYIDILSDGDNGMNVKLNVLVQVNLDWNNWQSPDLTKSSFRLLLSTEDTNGKEHKAIDINLIGTNDTLYIDAPILRTKGSTDTLGTKFLLKGINLVKIIEKQLEQNRTPSGVAATELATATADNSIATILKIIDEAIGEIQFKQDGITVGLAPKALVAVASILGLVPSVDSGLVDAIKGVIDTFPDTTEGSGVYINYAATKDNKTTPVIGLKYGLKGVGSVEINLHHYAIGVVNDLNKITDTSLPFKDGDGLKNMKSFDESGYTDLAKLPVLQLDINGELSAGLKATTNNGAVSPWDISELVQNVLGSILAIAPLNNIGAKINSDVQGNKTLKFNVKASLDFSNIVGNLQLGLTIYDKDDTDFTKVTLAVYYDKGSLYVHAPDYLQKTLRIDDLLGLFDSIGGAKSVADGETTEGSTEGTPSTPAQVGALQLIFGQEYMALNITSGVFAILTEVLQGMKIDISKNMFDCLENQLGIKITIGTNSADGELNLPDLYAGLNIDFGPVSLGLKASNPIVKIASNKSIVPDEILSGATHFAEATFRIKAEGRIGLSADNTVLDLNKLLKGFGVTESLDFGINLQDPTGVNKKPINLHLGLKIDAEICLGDFNKCKIGVRVVVHDGDNSSFDSVRDDAEGRELLAVYLKGKEVYLDLKNEIIDLTQVHISSDTMDSILKAITKTLAGDNNAEEENGAMSTADETANNVPQRTLANLIKLNFNGTGVTDENGIYSDLGSITAEIGEKVIDGVLELLGVDALIGAGLKGVVKIDTPIKDQTGAKSHYGVGINVTTTNGTLINNLGLYVWLGNIEVVKDTTAGAEGSLLPPSDLVNSDNLVELSNLQDQFINVDLTVSLSMFASKDKNGNNNIIETQPTDKKSLINQKLITEFFKGFVPWMQSEFLGQLLVNAKEGETIDWDSFLSSHSIRLQANINLGLLLNDKTCTNCGRDFSSKNSSYAKDKACPNCHVTGEAIEGKGFFLSDLDFAIELIRNKKVGEEIVIDKTLLGLYVENSQITFYGKEFGLNSFVIEKESVENIANTIKTLIGESTSTGTANNGALSTAGSTADNTATGGKADLDILGLIGKIVREVTVSMYAVRIAFNENVLSNIPTLMKSLGVEGFPEFGYPSLNENNYLQLGLISNKKIDLSLLLNFDMFGLNTSVSISDVSIGLGKKKDIEMPSVTGLDKLDTTNSVLNVNIEAELRLDVNKTENNNVTLSDLLGGLLGDLTVGYKNDSTITKDYLLRIRAQINIVDYTVVLGVEIIEQNKDNKVAPQTILGVYYDSSDSTAYVKSTILPNMKVTGLDLDALIGKLKAQSSAYATDGSGGTGAPTPTTYRPIINNDIITENSDKPSVKVTLAMQQFFAVAISGELISTILYGIDQRNSIPLLPDFEVGVRFGRNDANSPFAIGLQVGLGKNKKPDGKTGFLAELTASIPLGPIGYNTGDPANTMNAGTYVNFLTPTEANSGNNQIVTSEMKGYNTLLNITFDANGEIKPEVKATTVELNLTTYLWFGSKALNSDKSFSDMFAALFGSENVNAEFVAYIKALEERKTKLTVDIKAQVHVKNLIVSALNGEKISLAGTNLQVTVKDVTDKESANHKTIMQITFKGGEGKDGADAIYLRLYEAGVKNVNNITGTKEKQDIAVCVDTINIIDLVMGENAGSSALATGNTESANSSLAALLNVLIKEVEITQLTTENGLYDHNYTRVNVNFTENALDKLIEIVALLLLDTTGKKQEEVAKIDVIKDLLSKINMPSITKGGLYLEFNKDEKADVGLGIGAGIDMEINDFARILIGLEIGKFGVNTTAVEPDKTIRGSAAEVVYNKLSDGLQLNLNFKGYAEINNKNASDPMSIGSLITTVLGLIDKNINLGDVDFTVESKNVERYTLDLVGHIDTKDFMLPKPTAYNSKVRLTIKKEGLNANGTTGSVRTLVDVLLDLQAKAVYVDLEGMKLPKIKLTGLDLAGMLADVISPYLGGEKPASTGTATAYATAGGETNVTASKLSALLYLALGSDGTTTLRFNADLITAILRVVFGYLGQVDTTNKDTFDTLGGLALPNVGTIALRSYKVGEDTRYEMRIYRNPSDMENNYIALGVEGAGVNVCGDKVDVGTINAADFVPIYDLAEGLQLNQVYVDTTLTLDLDFSTNNNGAASFGRYLGRVLAMLIDKDESKYEKYQFKIISEKGNKKLQYQLRIKGVLDVNDLFGGSNLSVELWKMDTAGGSSPNNVMLLGAYLKKDTTNGLPTLYVDLNNLGLPRLKLVGIDGLLGGLGLSSATAQSNVLGTGEYKAVSQANTVKIKTGIIIEDDQVKLQINQGFIYSVLNSLLPNVFKNGYISIGKITIPLPDIKGVELDVPLKDGLKEINLKAYLEKDTDNHIGIQIALNKVEVIGGKNNAGKPITFDESKVNWSEVGDKYANANGVKVMGEDYFNTFGAIHISTSFLADMMNSIVESINPNVIIDYNKRGNSFYRVRSSGAGAGRKTAYQDALDCANWTVGGGGAKGGGAWNKILITRATGNQAQALRIAVVTRTGGSNRDLQGDNPITNLKTWYGQQLVDVYLKGDGDIMLDLTKVLKYLNMESVLKINLGLNLNIGNMIFPGTSAGATATAMSTSGTATAKGDASAALSELFGNLNIGEFLQGIEVRIYTDTKNEKNGGYAQTEIQVKVNPVTIKDLFEIVNWMLITEILSSGNTSHENVTREHANTPTHMYDTFKNAFINNNVSTALPGTLNLNMLDAEHDIANLLGSLLPLPSLNLNPAERFAMQTTSDQDGNATELVRSELTITLGYNPNDVGLIGALKSINAQFGNNYGMGTYDEGNVSQAKDAIRNELGYLYLDIHSRDNDDHYLNYNTSNKKGDIGLVGFKSVQTINNYNRDDASLKQYAEEYIPSGGSTLQHNTSATTVFTVQDPANAVEEIGDFIYRTLPTRANVTYLDGTSTGGALKGEKITTVSIVWDDSRISLSPNGSKDNFLYGWVQNKLIAKIRVNVKSAYELLEVERWTMDSKVPQNAVKFEKLAAGNIIKDGKTNIKMIMESYMSKDLPKTITIYQADGGDWTYSTEAVRVMRYRYADAKTTDNNGNAIPYQTFNLAEGTKEYNGKAVVEEAWTGKWWTKKPASGEVAIECQGKLDWDTSKLAWSAIDPYAVNTSVGNGTVAMTLTSGLMDAITISDIKVEVQRSLSEQKIIEALNEKFGGTSIDVLDIDIVDMPKFKDILVNMMESGGLKIELGGEDVNGYAYTLNLQSSEINFTLTEIENWIISKGNKYSGNTVKLPIKITRTIVNPQATGKKEKITSTFDLTVNIKKQELIELNVRRGKTTGTSSQAVAITLDPYKDFKEQLQEIFANKDGVRYFVEGVFRTNDGTLSKKQVNFDLDAFDMSSESRVKFDISSIYGKYTTKGGTVNMTVMVGDSKLGYTSATVPVKIKSRVLSKANKTIDIGTVDVLDENTLSNINKAYKLEVQFGYNDKKEADIIWFDKEKLIEAAKEGADRIEIDAIVGYKQAGETVVNNYLNQRVTLVAKVTQIKNVSLRTFEGITLTKNKDNTYTLPASIMDKTDLTSLGKVEYEYYSPILNTASKTITYAFDYKARAITVSIGLVDFTIKVDDNITKVNNFYVVDKVEGEGGVVTETQGNARVFTEEKDGSFLVKYSFIDKLPDELWMNVTVPTVANGKIVSTTKNVKVTFEKGEGITDEEYKKERVAIVRLGVYEIKVRVTK